MNLGKIAIGIGIFVGGLALGGLSTYSFIKNRLEKEYDERLNEETDRIRGLKTEKNEDLTSENDFIEEENEQEGVIISSNNRNGVHLSASDCLYLRKVTKNAPNMYETIVKKLTNLKIYGDGDICVDENGNGIVEDEDEFVFYTAYPGLNMDYITYEVINCIYYPDMSAIIDQFDNRYTIDEVGGAEMVDFLVEYGNDNTPIFSVARYKGQIFSVRLSELPYLDGLEKDDPEYLTIIDLMRQGYKPFDDKKLMDLSKMVINP